MELVLVILAVIAVFFMARLSDAMADSHSDNKKDDKDNSNLL